MLVGGLFASAYFFPYLVNGQDAYVLVHDNLDQVGRLGVTDQGRTVDFAFQLDRILFYVFGFFPGYVINEFCYRLVAFLGLFFLLRRIRDGSDFPDYLIFLISVSFVSLPFWPRGNLSVSGIPLLIFLFHNLYIKKHTVLTCLALFLFTFYSSFVLSGIFVVFLLLIWFVYLWKTKKMHRTLLVGGMVFVVGYVANNHDLLLSFFASGGQESSRAEMRLSQLRRASDFVGAIKQMIWHFGDAHYHAKSNHKIIVFPSSLLIFIFLAWRRKLAHGNILALLFACICFSAVIFGLYYFKPLMILYERLSIGFNYTRIFFLSPGLWYVLWGLLLINFYTALGGAKHVKIVIAVLLALQIGWNFQQATLANYLTRPTYRQFFSTELFDKIKKEIELGDDEKVGCIGFYPSVANYNGLRTIGAYKAIYPLRYKHQFYEVIKDELGQNLGLMRYFLYWGSRAYLYDDKIARYYSDQDYIKQNILFIETDLNMQALKEMGVKYLFSTAKIANAREKNLQQVFVSDKPSAYYRMYVYRVW